MCQDGLDRRQYLRRASTLAVTGSILASSGCFGPLTTDDPDPVVVRAVADPPVEETIPGEEVTVSLLVHNAGTAGEIAIVVEMVDANAQPVTAETLVVDMPGEHQEEISYEMTVPSRARAVQAQADAHDGTVDIEYEPADDIGRGDDG